MKTVRISMLGVSMHQLGKPRINGLPSRQQKVIDIIKERLAKVNDKLSKSNDIPEYDMWLYSLQVLNNDLELAERNDQKIYEKYNVIGG